jgi:hypothetical protein
MDARKRFALLVFAGTALMLATATSALATPTLSVASDNASNTVISYSQAATDAPLASLRLMVPASYLFNFGEPLGFVNGSATGQALVADLGDAPQTLSGVVKVGTSNDLVSYGGALATLASIGSACTGGATTNAYYVITLAMSGSAQVIQIPIFAVQPTALDPLAATTGLYLYLCYPPSGVPGGTPGRATLGASIQRLTFNFDRLFSVATGPSIWHGRVTPYVAGASSTINSAGAVEVESEDYVGQALALKVRRETAGTVRVSGRLTGGGLPLPGQRVSVLAGKRSVASAVTKTDGRFTVVAKTTASSLSASSTLTAIPQPSCVQPLLAPLPCASLTIGGGIVVTTAHPTAATP